MAKYNLLEDDDLFEEDDIIPEDKSEIPALAEEDVPENDEIDIDIDEDLLNIEPSETMAESAFDVNSDIDIGEEEPEININEPNILDGDPDTEPETKASEYSSTAPLLTDDFEDEKQEGINYRPIIMVGVIIIAAILIFIGIDHFFLSGSSSADTQAVIQKKDGTPEEKAKIKANQKEKEIQQKKQVFLNNLFSENKAKAKLTGQVLNSVQGSAKLSSLLLYDQSMLFEVFGKSRDALAKVNVRLKKQASQTHFNVVSSNIRPGSDGGVLSVFKGTVSTGTPISGDVTTNGNANSISDLENILRADAKNVGLRTTQLTNHFKDEKSGFRRFDVEASFSGSLKSCTDFVSGLSRRKQINIHKMRITAKDQKTFSIKKYNISLILEVFI